MSLKHLLLASSFLLTGCGYHFGTEVDAFDMLPRPVVGKRISVNAQDTSLPSRLYAARIAASLTKSGFIVSPPPADYSLTFRYHETRATVDYRAEPVTGVVDYVIDSTKTVKTADGKKKKEYHDAPVEGTVGMNVVSKNNYSRQMDLSIHTGGEPAREMLSMSMQSDTTLVSDAEAYSAMIEAVLSNLNEPLRSGNYLSVVPPQ